MGRRKLTPVSKHAAASTGASSKRPPKRAAQPDDDGATTRSETPSARIIERPDGFYWESKEERAERGPFATLAEAEASMLSGGEADEADPGETLQEAESELGIAEWIDPDTGGPAEDSVPRIEDH